MCVCVPSRVVSLDGHGRAMVESLGVRREVSVSLLDEALAVGDYVLVRAGAYAFERIDEARALDALDLYAQIEMALAEAALP